MSTGTGIEWTESTWNPVVGCTRASAGCDNCYAVTMTHRLEAMGKAKYRSLTVLNRRGDRHFNGTVRTVPEALEIPLRWRKPRRIFVNSMSDLFHRDVPFDFIDRVFAVMALCPQHTFQVLTKRPERMAEYLAPGQYRDVCVHDAMTKLCSTLDDGTIPAKLDPLNGRKFVVPRHLWAQAPAFPPGMHWPLPNVWLGTSVENQAMADERIPHLLRCPAAVRFLSCEPLLEAIRLRGPGCAGCFNQGGHYPGSWVPCRFCFDIQWVIAGGESGGNTRPCNVAWIRSIVQQCRAAGVSCFVKQLGSIPLSEGPIPMLKNFSNGGNARRWPCLDRKGGDPDEWPEDLRVREWPRAVNGGAS